MYSPSYNLKEDKRGPGLSELEKRKLLLSGWAGVLNEEELDYVRDALVRDRKLAQRWGFKPSMKIHDAGIRRVAMDGSDENWKINVALVRPKTSPLRGVKAVSRA